jgi:hypothetical protein
MKKYKLLETIADIAYLAGERKFYSGDSRADVSEFIRWAGEFEKVNSGTNWDEQDYILSVTNFTEEKLLSSKE